MGDLYATTKTMVQGFRSFDANHMVFAYNFFGNSWTQSIRPEVLRAFAMPVSAPSTLPINHRSIAPAKRRILSANCLCADGASGHGVVWLKRQQRLLLA